MLLSIADINKISKSVHDYKGCFNVNKLPSLKYGYYVILVIPKNQRVGHFICFANEGDSIFYFDPYGEPPFPKLLKWFGNKNINYSDIDIEGDKSDSCGLFCVYIIKHLSNGGKISDIYNNFNFNEEKLDLNDKIVGGNIITEAAKRVYYAIKGEREIAPPPVREFIEKNGDFIITTIEVHRNPVDKKIEAVLNVISRGQFQKNKEALAYDDVFHLYLRIGLSNGLFFWLEKNQVVQIKRDEDVENRQGQIMPVNLGGKQISFREFLSKGSLADPQFWIYSPYNENCQHFVTVLLRSNGLLTPELNQFINQSAHDLFKDSPITKKISKLVTGLAARIDILFHGRGIAPFAKVKNDIY